MQLIYISKINISENSTQSRSLVFMMLLSSRWQMQNDDDDDDDNFSIHFSLLNTCDD